MEVLKLSSVHFLSLAHTGSAAHRLRPFYNLVATPFTLESPFPSWPIPCAVRPHGSCENTGWRLSLRFLPFPTRRLVLAPSARGPGAVWSTPRCRVLLKLPRPRKGEEILGFLWIHCARAATQRSRGGRGVSHTWVRRQLPHNGFAALAPAGQMVSLPLEFLWVSRSFCQERTWCVCVCRGRRGGTPLRFPLLSPQEEFSSKTKARGHRRVASGLFPVLRPWGLGPCSGDFWFVLSQ